MIEFLAGCASTALGWLVWKGITGRAIRHSRAEHEKWLRRMDYLLSRSKKDYETRWHRKYEGRP